MTPEAKQAMHEAIIKAIRPSLLEAPFVIDWSTVSTENYYEEPWSYSEYTAGGGDFTVSISGEFLAWDPDWFDGPAFYASRSLSPTEFGEFVSELFA